MKNYNGTITVLNTSFKNMLSCYKTCLKKLNLYNGIRLFLFSLLLISALWKIITFIKNLVSFNNWIKSIYFNL